MRRYRNARYAPESLEAQAEPDGHGHHAAPGNAQHHVGRPHGGGLLLRLDGDEPPPSSCPSYMSAPGAWSGPVATTFPPDYIAFVALADNFASSPNPSYGDILVADGDGDGDGNPIPPIPPIPGEGLPPIGGPTNPVGPVVPA